jgi:hypothetical protein
MDEEEGREMSGNLEQAPRVVREKKEFFFSTCANRGGFNSFLGELEKRGLGGTRKGKEALLVPVWRRIFEETRKPRA